MLDLNDIPEITEQIIVKGVSYEVNYKINPQNKIHFGHHHPLAGSAWRSANLPYRFSIKELLTEEKLQDIHDWLGGNTISVWWSTWSILFGEKEYIFYFKDSRDAIKAKLTWG